MERNCLTCVWGNGDAICELDCVNRSCWRPMSWELPTSAEVDEGRAAKKVLRELVEAIVFNKAAGCANCTRDCDGCTYINARLVKMAKAAGGIVKEGGR